MSTVCRFKDCGRGGKLIRGLCHGHYKQLQLGKELAPLKRQAAKLPCQFDDCERPFSSKGLCKSHYMQQWAGKPLTPLDQPRERRECAFRGCRQTAHTKGWCRGHYSQTRRGGDLRPLRIWEYKPRLDAKGYVIEWSDHPNARKRPGRKGGIILQHVRVMSEMLGRPLQPNERVHHRNGVRHDNRSANLELWVKTQPSGQRATDLVVWAREILDRYERVVDAGIA